MVTEQTVRSGEYFAISLLFGIFTKLVASSAVAAASTAAAAAAANGGAGGSRLPWGLLGLVILGLVLSHWALCFFALGVSLLLKLRPWTKKSVNTGAIPLYSQWFWYPNATYIIIKLFLRRFVYKNRLPVISEIAPRLYLGGLPGFPGVNADVLSHIKAAVDVTCEFPPLRVFERYVCIPAWDCTAPTAEDIKRATDWIWDEYCRSKRSILIHCCSGVGRSTTVMCAALVKCKICMTIHEAYELIRKRRSFAKLKGHHMNQLNKWLEIEKKHSC